MKKRIWCLFTSANDYDQPNNNLQAWWSEKPSLEDLEKVEVCKGAIRPVLDGILAGATIRLQNYFDTRLEEVAEGEVS